MLNRDHTTCFVVCVYPKALCAAVVLPDVLQTMALVFSGADVMCATGDPEYSTPYLLAQKAGQRLQMEFLYHNKLSGVCVCVYVRVCVRVCVCTFPMFSVSKIFIYLVFIF